MARTKKQIEQSLASDMEAINPSLDTVKGPVPDIFIRPQASQLRSVEVLIDDLNKSLQGVLPEDMSTSSCSLGWNLVSASLYQPVQ